MNFFGRKIIRMGRRMSRGVRRKSIVVMMKSRNVVPFGRVMLLLLLLQSVFTRRQPTIGMIVRRRVRRMPLWSQRRRMVWSVFGCHDDDTDDTDDNDSSRPKFRNDNDNHLPPFDNSHFSANHHHRHHNHNSFVRSFGAAPHTGRCTCASSIVLFLAT